MRQALTTRRPEIRDGWDGSMRTGKHCRDGWDGCFRVDLHYKNGCPLLISLSLFWDGWDGKKYKGGIRRKIGGRREEKGRGRGVPIMKSIGRNRPNRPNVKKQQERKNS